jgi:DNA-binding protein H-NS
MAKTYEQLTKQIAALQAQADKVKRAGDIKGVVERINEAIAHYRLKASDFRFTAVGKRAKPKPDAVAATSAKYRDPATGTSWGGRGPRPGWLRAPLGAGRTLDDFLAGAAKAKSATPAKKARKTRVAGFKTAASAPQTPAKTAQNGSGAVLASPPAH